MAKLLLAAALLAAPWQGALAVPPPRVGAQVVGGGGGRVAGGVITVETTIGQGITGPASGADAAVAAGYWGTPPIDADWTVCGMGTGASVAFNRTFRPRIDVEAAGTIACIRVARTDAAHPDAVAGIDPRHYWALTAQDAAGAGASGFTVALTFPHPDLVAPYVCRSLGGGAWDCVQSSFTAATVTREGVTELSEWAVSSGFVVPVELRCFVVE